LYDVCLTVAWMKEEMLHEMEEQIFQKCYVNSQSPWNNNATRRSEITVVHVYHQESKSVVYSNVYVAGLFILHIDWHFVLIFRFINEIIVSLVLNYWFWAKTQWQKKCYEFVTYACLISIKVFRKRQYQVVKFVLEYSSLSPPNFVFF